MIHAIHATVFFVLTLVACCMLYLSHPRQAFLRRSLPLLPWRPIGSMLLGAGLVCAFNAFSALTAVCAWLATLLLAFLSLMGGADEA
jgi:uncharacterized membrane protein